MENYEEVRVKLIDTHLCKLQYAAKIRQEQYQDWIRKTLKMKNCHMNDFWQQDKQLK